MLLCLGLSAGAAPAFAGAWPRAEGDGFVSVASRLSWPQEVSQWASYAPTRHYSTLYIEYGLSQTVTLGLDLGTHLETHLGRPSPDGSKTLAFVQVPLRNRDTGPKISAQLGLGQISGQTVVRPGLSMGWGLSKGWMSFDTLAEIQIQGGATDVKLDATWGRDMPGKAKLILQLQTGHHHRDGGFARLEPSYVRPLYKSIKAEVGGIWGLEGDTTMGLKFGLWADF